mmetsp:Transcript_20827/g.52761  ORF Transcript_20827/g.52761 Transcript_20827/m.52761 type:complete len:227 (+) Transcript_20827:22-702(+)
MACRAAAAAASPSTWNTRAKPSVGPSGASSRRAKLPTMRSALSGDPEGIVGWPSRPTTRSTQSSAVWVKCTTHACRPSTMASCSQRRRSSRDTLHRSTTTAVRLMARPTRSSQAPRDPSSSWHTRVHRLLEHSSSANVDLPDPGSPISTINLKRGAFGRRAGAGFLARAAGRAPVPALATAEPTGLAFVGPSASGAVWDEAPSVSTVSAAAAEAQPTAPVAIAWPD